MTNLVKFLIGLIICILILQFSPAILGTLILVYIFIQLFKPKR